MKFSEEAYKKFTEFTHEVKSATDYKKYRMDYNVDQFYKISNKYYPLVSIYIFDRRTLEEFIEEIYNDSEIDTCIISGDYDYIMKFYETPIEQDGNKYLISLKIKDRKLQLILDETTGKFEHLCSDTDNISYIECETGVQRKVFKRNSFYNGGLFPLYDIKNIRYKNDRVYIDKVISQISCGGYINGNHIPTVTSTVSIWLNDGCDMTFKIDNMIIKTKVLSEEFSVEPVIESRYGDGTLYEITNYKSSIKQQTPITELTELGDFNFNNVNYKIIPDNTFKIKTDDINKYIHDLICDPKHQIIYIGNVVIQPDANIIAMKK